MRRYAKRIALASPALALIVIAVSLFFISKARARRERLEDFSTAVNRYDDYARAYAHFAEKKDHLFETCYGGKWDSYSQKIYRDLQARSADIDYLREKSAHFAKLHDKYQGAVTHPEAEISLDPPMVPE